MIRALLTLAAVWLCAAAPAPISPVPSLATLAQQAYQDVVNKFWWNAGTAVGAGYFDGIEEILTTSAITGISNGNPAVVTTGFPSGILAGTPVWISGAAGMTQVNGGPYAAASPSGATFQLSGVNSTSWGTYAGGAVASFYLPSPMRAPTGVDDLWGMAQSANVAYSLWKTTGSSDALARLQAHWQVVKARWPLIQIQQCQTYGTAAAQDDAAWASMLLVELWEASGDPVAGQYAQGMLDCAWTRWEDSTLGGGLWYDDTKTSKSSYQGTYALASYQYWQDGGAITYHDRAVQIENWAAVALYRNGQVVTALNTEALAIALPYANTIASGDSVTQTLSGSCIPTTPLTYNESNTDTPYTIASGLAALVNGNATLTAAGLSATAPGETESVFSPAGCPVTITASVTPGSGSVTATAKSYGPGAGSFTYPTDGLYWIDTQPNGSAADGVSQFANQPYSIHEASSVTMIEAQMAFAALDARLYNETGTAAYLTRLNQIATGIRTYETIGSTNVLMDDRDQNVDGFSAWFYAHDVLPLLNGAPGTQADQTTLVTTAWTAALNARCPDGTYGGGWEGPCMGAWSKPVTPGPLNESNVVSSQAPNVIVAGYYASLH